MDGYIYILLQPDVKKLLVKKVRKYSGFLALVPYIETRSVGRCEDYSVNKYSAWNGLNGVVVITAITDRYYSVQRCAKANRAELDSPM